MMLIVFKLKIYFYKIQKRIIIMKGKYNKIMYSDDLITTHGIFLKIPFQTSLVRDHTLQRTQKLNKNRSMDKIV